MDYETSRVFQLSGLQWRGKGLSRVDSYRAVGMFSPFVYYAHTSTRQVGCHAESHTNYSATHTTLQLTLSTFHFTLLVVHISPYSWVRPCRRRTPVHAAERRRRRRRRWRPSLSCSFVTYFFCELQLERLLFGHRVCLSKRGMALRVTCGSEERLFGGRIIPVWSLRKTP